MLHCNECFKNENQERLTQIKGTIICWTCVSKTDIKKALRPSFECYECNLPIYDKDLKHEFDRNVSLIEYIFSTSETEKLYRCDKCYKKQKLREENLKKFKQVLFFSAIILLLLWIRMFHWKTIEELLENYPFAFLIFVIMSFFSVEILYLLIFNNWCYKTVDNRNLKKKN